MEYKSLGSTLRSSLLKYSVMERISIWEFNEWNAIWMTMLSSARMISFFAITTIISVCSLGFIIIRKRSFTQKDTLCAFIFMVVSIFLLDSVQTMRKIEISLDKSYKDIEIKIPFSSFFLNTPINRQKMCSTDFNSQLERSIDDIQLGEKASAAYRNLVRNNVLQKRPLAVEQLNPVLNNTSVVSLPASAPINTEYCIYKMPSVGRPDPSCVGCQFLDEKEFAEAREDLKYIDSVNRQYQDIERNLVTAKGKYKTYSVDLMNNFKTFNKVSYFVRDELVAVGIDFKSIENAILELINKYEAIFSGSVQNITKLQVDSDSLCVSIKNTETKPFSSSARTVGKGPVRRRTSKVIVKEQETYRPNSMLVIKSGLAEDPSQQTIEDAIHQMVQSNIRMPADLVPAINASTRSGGDDPFFTAMRYTLIATEALIFIQVILVMGVIFSIIFGMNWLYLAFYFSMCGSLIISLILGFIAFVNSTAVDSLCKSGLKCSMQASVAQDGTAIPVSRLIDVPEMALRDSVTRSTNRLQKQINTVLTSNTFEEIQTIAGQLDRLFQIKKDFPNLIASNANREVIDKDAIYQAADKMNASLDNIKSLDKQIRNTGWTETFKKLSQVNILLSDTTYTKNIKKRQALSGLSNGTVITSDMSSCAGKEEAVCELKRRFDSLFIGLFLFAVVLSIAIAA
ncbi:hypothetical protein NEAUS04_0360 [Nematocida ausubeli]|nr:hypothetical protein NEAUS04_0285 [Nematocida ausubeli]KAI5161204.1 hypothetical protein NEAUS04_0360 [Nematocida ausubeli]